MTATANPISTAQSTGEPPWNQSGPAGARHHSPMAGHRQSILAGVTFGLLPAVVWPWQLVDARSIGTAPYYCDLSQLVAQAG